MFLEYQSPREAQEAVKNANSYKLDKQHTFVVQLFSDFDKYMNVKEEWETPEPQPFKDHVSFCVARDVSRFCFKLSLE